MISAQIKISRKAFSLDVSFDAGAGITALFGPSGSGKSTILNAIAGLTTPDKGRIKVGDRVVFDRDANINVPTHRRGIGYVFQDALLFPHMSVAANLRYGTSATPENFDTVVETLGLARLLGRKPSTLSGGERQRVALGRAVFSSPRLLLMDEPLSSLDGDRKQEILTLIESLRDALHLPILYVSHAVEEVARLASSVIVLNAGRIIRHGPPGIALDGSNGTSRFERVSILTATARDFSDAYGLTTLGHPSGTISVPGHLPVGTEVHLPIPATDVALATMPPQNLSIRTALEGIISTITEIDRATVTVEVTLTGGETLAASATRKAVSEMKLLKGTRVWCLIKSVAIDERWLKQEQS